MATRFTLEEDRMVKAEMSHIMALDVFFDYL